MKNMALLKREVLSHYMMKARLLSLNRRKTGIPNSLRDNQVHTPPSYSDEDHEIEE